MKLYPFGRFSLAIPDDHKLSEIHRTHPFYDRLSYMALAELLQSAEGAIVDIGANIGDSAAQFRTVCDLPIVCVEGAEEFIACLRYNAPRLGDGVTLVERFVAPAGAHDGGLRYVAEAGTGFLEPCQAGDQPIEEARYIAVGELLEIARAAANGAEPAFIKVDTDGMDAGIVDELLDRVRCPILFECDTVRLPAGATTPWPALFARLDSETEGAVVFDNVGLPLLCVERSVGSVLRDLSGHLHLQRAVTPVRTHYLDVLAFPRGAGAQYAALSERLRADLLKPYRF